MSAYYATGGPAQGPAGPSTLTPVLVSFAGPAPQSRVTVAFRFLMVIPHSLILVTMACLTRVDRGAQQAGEQVDTAYDDLISALTS